jgi:hypothetical protein
VIGSRSSLGPHPPSPIDTRKNNGNRAAPPNELKRKNINLESISHSSTRHHVHSHLSLGTPRRRAISSSLTSPPHRVFPHNQSIRNRPSARSRFRSTIVFSLLSSLPAFAARGGRIPASLACRRYLGLRQGVVVVAGRSRMYHGDDAPAWGEAVGGEPVSERARASSQTEVMRCCWACGSWFHSRWVICWCSVVWIAERTSSARKEELIN